MELAQGNSGENIFKDYSDENSESDIPAIVMVLMIVLACLVTLAICLAIFGLVGWKRKRSNIRNTNPANGARLDHAQAIESNENNNSLNLRRQYPLDFQNLFHVEGNEHRSNNINRERPPSYENIFKVDEKDLPSYEDVIRHTG